MNDRETFDLVRDHLLFQGAACMGQFDTGYYGCLYRDVDKRRGRRCAVGVLIKDEFYSPTLEKQSVSVFGGGSVLDAVRASGCQADYILLSLLQKIHDGAIPDEWSDKLASLERLWFRGEKPSYTAEVVKEEIMVAV